MLCVCLCVFMSYFLTFCSGDVFEKSTHSKPLVSAASDAADILECLRQQLANGNASYISKIPSEMIAYPVDKLNSCCGHKSATEDAAEKSSVSNVSFGIDATKDPCEDMLNDKWKSQQVQAESQSLVSQSEVTVKGQRSVTSSYCGLMTGLTGEVHVASIGHLDSSSGHAVVDSHQRLPVSTALDQSCDHSNTGGVTNINTPRPGGGNLLGTKNFHCGGQTVAIATSGHSVAMATDCMQLNQLPLLASYDSAIVVRRNVVDKYAASDIGLLQSNVVTQHVDGMVLVPGSALVASYGLTVPVSHVLNTAALSDVILDNQLLAQTDTKDRTSPVHSQVNYLLRSQVGS